MADQKDRHKRDIAPILDKRDREVYFAVRKIFSGEDVDEKTYDTTSYTSPDIWAYLITYGYKSVDDRFKFSIETANDVIKLRRKHGLGPILRPEYWNPKWKFSIPEAVFQKEWPTCALGRDKDGVMVVFDSIGAISMDFVNLLNNTPDGFDAATHWVVKTLENFARVKMMMSNNERKRITSYVAVIDAATVGVTTLNALRQFFEKTTSEMQVMYPEVTKKLYIVNTGWLFRAAWVVIRQFLDPTLVAKILVCGSNWKEDVKADGIYKIPSFMGGKCKDYIIGGDNIFIPDKGLSLDDEKVVSFRLGSSQPLEEKKTIISLADI